MKYTAIFTALLAATSLSFGNQISADQQQFIKKYEKQKAITAPEEALLNTDTEPDLSEGFTELYNGKDLSGWTPIGGHCTFEATPEAIVGKCVKGSPSTYLSTDKNDYTDFIFTAELKWLVDGNSGVIFRGTPKPTKNGEPTAVGPQAEMEGFEGHNGERGWSGGVYAQGYGGWLYPLWLDAHAKARKALKKDQWNRITVKAVGSSIKTWVNGVPAANYTEQHGYNKGFFSLQVHSGTKGEVHFRNIKVKELTDGFEDLFATGDFSKWTKVNGDPVAKGWSIHNGVIQRSGIRPGDIITQQHYENFELRFDWKISKAGNSGVKYRTRGSLGLEYQVLDDAKHKDRKNPTHRAASLYELVAAPESKPLKPVGEWNHARILAKGNTIEHWLNGEKVVEIAVGSDDWKTKFQNSKYKKHEGFGSWAGPILLQDHNDEVWYRNVQIREL